jgi:hypothetical protein
MNNEDPLMDDEQAGDAVAGYLEENPELLQGIVPEHDLWPAIESRISARVIPMQVPLQGPLQGPSRKLRAVRAPMGWIPTLIAASALIAGTAGITYVVTMRANAPGSAASVASAAAAVRPNAGPIVSAAPDARQASAAGAPASQSALSDNPSDHDAASAPATAQAGSTPATQARLAHVQLVSCENGNGPSGDQARTTYDTEIAALHTLLDARRSQLNPATVTVIEQNLKVIDEAIRQSTDALARDPNSRLLNDQLDHALAQKTGLLRAAVLLPAA